MMNLPNISTTAWRTSTDNLYWFLAEILPCGGRPKQLLPQIWADQRLGHCRAGHAYAVAGRTFTTGRENAGLYPS